MSSLPPDANGAAELDALVGKILASYEEDGRTQHLDATFLPNRARAINIIELLRRLVFPGFFDGQRLTRADIRYHAGDLLTRIRQMLFQQVNEALRYQLNQKSGHGADGDDCGGCDEQARRTTMAFLDRLPRLRRRLALDVQAAFDGDPAAVNTDEAIFCYPGLDAIFIHRLAHELCMLGVPLLPRIMSEYAHNETGIDIHPGARIGDSFFIDHGTGVVIGETTQIGARVQIYQGVTLGALAPKDGTVWRGQKRHPTIEDDVTIYAGAIILGGDTVIGHGCTIGGSVFITQSVPPGHTVTMKPPDLSIKQKRKAERGQG